MAGLGWCRGKRVTGNVIFHGKCNSFLFCRYHRIKRKGEKRAASKHTFEQLQKENPELAKTELEKAERLRAAVCTLKCLWETFSPFTM